MSIPRGGLTSSVRSVNTLDALYAASFETVDLDVNMIYSMHLLAWFQIVCYK